MQQLIYDCFLDAAQDSLIIGRPPGRDTLGGIDCGLAYGQFKSELDADDEAVAFFALGMKNYAILKESRTDRRKRTADVKVRGVRC